MILKMKLGIASDLHLEFFKDHAALNFINELDSDGVDVLVLAGDILSIKRQMQMKAILSAFKNKYKNVVWVLGNHEYYNNIPRCTQLALREAEKAGVHLLNNSSVTIDGQRFIGGTGWFPELPDTTAFHKHCMTDFDLIDHLEPWVYKEHEYFVDFLTTCLKPEDVLVMHHLPTTKSVHSKYAGNHLNRFFLCDIEKLILDRQPKLVINGHGHDQFDYKIGETRIISNPKGYEFEATRKYFNPKLVVEV